MYTAKKPLPPTKLVKANIKIPPDKISSAYSPSAKCSRCISLAKILPPITPASKPKPICCTSMPKNDNTPASAGFIMMAINAVTKKIAIGSLAPDSTSSVANTRWFRRTPLLRSNENTAAASVEPTIAAISKPNRQSTPNTQVTNKPSGSTVATTPHVASTADGRHDRRKVCHCVRKPPSSRITASANCPTIKAPPRLSKRKPPIPSSPANMPTPKNTNSKGNPKRADTRVAITLTNSSKPPIRNKALMPSSINWSLKNKWWRAI